jgi:hypothetical protein
MDASMPVCDEIDGVSTRTMGTPDDRAWGRIRGGLVKGVLFGATGGAIVGLIVGAIVFRGIEAVLTSMLAGVIGLGGLGAFWGVLSGLESPAPGEEPGDIDRPLEVPELTSEEHDRRPRN